MAGSAGIGEGDRPKRPKCEGELGALEPLKEDRLDEDFSMGGGGNIDADGVLATEVAGVRGAAVLLLCRWLPDGISSASRSLTVVPTDSVSLAVDSLRNILGRL